MRSMFKNWKKNMFKMSDVKLDDVVDELKEKLKDFGIDADIKI